MQFSEERVYSFNFSEESKILQKLITIGLRNLMVSLSMKQTSVCNTHTFVVLIMHLFVGFKIWIFFGISCTWNGTHVHSNSIILFCGILQLLPSLAVCPWVFSILSASTGRWTEARIRDRAQTSQNSNIVSSSNKSLFGGGVEITGTTEAWELSAVINYPWPSGLPWLPMT